MAAVTICSDFGPPKIKSVTVPTVSPWHRLPQFWELASRNGNNQRWNWRLTVPKTIKITQVRPQMTSLKMTVWADCAVYARSPHPRSIKALAHLAVTVGRSQPSDRCPPSSSSPWTSGYITSCPPVSLPYLPSELNTWLLLPCTPLLHFKTHISLQITWHRLGAFTLKWVPSLTSSQNHVGNLGSS